MMGFGAKAPAAHPAALDKSHKKLVDLSLVRWRWLCEASPAQRRHLQKMIIQKEENSSKTICGWKTHSTSAEQVWKNQLLIVNESCCVWIIALLSNNLRPIGRLAGLDIGKIDMLNNDATRPHMQSGAKTTRKWRTPSTPRRNNPRRRSFRVMSGFHCTNHLYPFGEAILVASCL